MEQISTLTERIATLKDIAGSMHEGAVHTRLFPEVDKILALPDELHASSVGEREAVARQVREYEQTFEGLGFSLLTQIMPTAALSPIFEIVRAADQFKSRLRHRIGTSFQLEDDEVTVEPHHFDVLTRYSLSIGTPPVTDTVRALVGRTLLGQPATGLLDYLETLPANRVDLEQLLIHLEQLVQGSLHYNTAVEEASFVRDAAEFVNFEGGRLFSRIVITESPRRVIDLIERHLFDKFGPGQRTAVRVVEGIDKLDDTLIARMRAEPNSVFVARVTRIPQRLFRPDRFLSGWRSVIGRLVLIDDSQRARKSNTTIVYTLFPHVTRTLRTIQTSLAGRPANTQLWLRRILERFSPETLGSLADALKGQLEALETEGVARTTVEEIRTKDWKRDSLFDYLTLVKLHRFVSFVQKVAASSDDERQAIGSEMRQRVASDWMSYFYTGLPAESYTATVLPGGGRGVLSMIGDFHREELATHVEHFCRDHLVSSRERLAGLKTTLAIPDSSTDEISAAVRQSELRALSPSQWKPGERKSSLPGHLTKTMGYRLADVSSRAARKARDKVDRVAFGNLTGGASAVFKKAMSRAGFGALHGRLEDVVGEKLGRADRRMRKLLMPLQEMIRAAQRAGDERKGELDPVAIGEIEAVLNLVEQRFYYPTLILPEMSWSYGDVFPEKYFPKSSTVRIPLNEHHEMSPVALLQRLEELRYLFRQFPELFELVCRSTLVVINSPNNPTGVVYRRETVLKLLLIASEYDLTVVDDNSYHKLVISETKAREGDLCVAQLYERYRSQFAKPVRILTAGATTKGLQGAGDRTGLLHANVPEAVAYAEKHASEPHLMSLYFTELKLETGLAAKRYTNDLEQLATRLVEPGRTPWERLDGLLQDELEHAANPSFPVAVFETVLDGYGELLRLRGRGGSVRHLSERLSTIVSNIKSLRLERVLRDDVEKRLGAALEAYGRVAREDQPHEAARRPPGDVQEVILPQGAFYFCVRLCDADNDKGVQEFLQALSRHRKVDMTYAGKGFVRISLGGELPGTTLGYENLGVAIEVFLRTMRKYWARFEQAGREVADLDALFAGDASPPSALLGDSEMAEMFRDFDEILATHVHSLPRHQGLRLDTSERGTIYAIEEGRSLAEKVFVELDATDGGPAGMAPCETVDELLQSRAFRVIYRRLLKLAHARIPALAELYFEQVENQYGPLPCLAAYRDRQLIDDVFRELLSEMYQQWHGSSTIRILAARLEAQHHPEKVAALYGISEKLNVLINELMRAFDTKGALTEKTTGFEVGFESLDAIEPSPSLPDYLGQIISRTSFAGATAPLSPAPVYVTGAAKRVSDHRYQFSRREVQRGGDDVPLAYFRTRLERFAQSPGFEHYFCKAVQVGPFQMLLLMHRSTAHLLSDELRLFPQIEQVQLREALDHMSWDGVLLFGVPTKVLGSAFRSGYVHERKEDGSLLPVAWVAREDATDYVGFLKKSLLTLHNERVKAMGGMPVHGAMITITFKNGLRKTLVFSADSGTGKSEMITAMMEQLAAGAGQAVEMRQIDILAGDMLSLWRGEDEQIYAFGTETGDFMRLTDITESWKARFGDLIKRGTFSNLDHPKNPRVTIPRICDARKVLSPTRINGFFYINNYEPTQGSAVELSDDPHHVLKHILVRGLRKNKGTSGDQPSLRAGLEFAGEHGLVARFRHTIDELLEWRPRVLDGRTHECLVYRDGAEDVFVAKDLVSLAFRGRAFEYQGGQHTVASIHYDDLQNLFWVRTEDRQRLPLDRRVYDQVYEPLVSTFCGNPFVDPEGMDRTLSTFAETMRRARIHTGVIKTQLARDGYEFDGPASAGRDIVAFLMDDDEVNDRFQRNKNKVQQAMERTYGAILDAGSNLPVELEGYNLLLLEEHESTHVAFYDNEGTPFAPATPFYRYEKTEQRPAARPSVVSSTSGAPDQSRGGAVSEASSPRYGEFVPALVLPEVRAIIVDIGHNPDLDIDLGKLEVDLADYDAIRYWNDLEELTYAVLLVNGVISLGSTDSEVARFPFEVRKARAIAQRIAANREPKMGAEVVHLQRSDDADSAHEGESGDVG